MDQQAINEAKTYANTFVVAGVIQTLSMGDVSYELNITKPGGHYGIVTIDLNPTGEEQRYDLHLSIDNGDNLSPRELLEVGKIALDWFDREVRPQNPEWTFTGE